MKQRYQIINLCILFNFYIFLAIGCIIHTIMHIVHMISIYIYFSSKWMFQENYFFTMYNNAYSSHDKYIYIYFSSKWMFQENYFFTMYNNAYSSHVTGIQNK